MLSFLFHGCLLIKISDILLYQVENIVKIVIPVMGIGRSGGERVLANLANELVKRGEEVIIVAPENNCTPYYELNCSILTSQIKKTNFKTLNFLFNMYYLWRKVKSVNADVAIANYFLTAYVVFLLGRKVDKFYYIQAYEVLFSNHLHRKLLAYITYFLPLKKIVNSELLLPSYLNNYVSIVPAGIDLSLYRNFKDSYYCDKEVINIGFIGRKELYKGSQEIVDVLIELNNEFKGKLCVNVAVYCDGKWSAKLPNLNFFDIKNEFELAEFYKANDIVVATGLIEDGAFHYPCAEAIASSCLVISNYAPLTLSNSELKLSTFNSINLKNKLSQCFKFSKDRIESELNENYKLVKHLSWESVADEFYSVIKSEVL